MGRVVGPLREMGADLRGVAGGSGCRSRFWAMAGFEGVRACLAGRERAGEEFACSSPGSSPTVAWALQSPAGAETTRSVCSGVRVRVEVEEAGDGSWRVAVEPPGELRVPGEIEVPGDFSSSAFWMAAALVVRE